MSSSLHSLVNNLAKGGHGPAGPGAKPHEFWGFEKRSPKQK